MGRIASVDALAVSRPRLLPCCCDQHGLVAAHPENRLCETMAQHPELIWIKTVHARLWEIKILQRVRVVLPHRRDACWMAARCGSSPPNGPSTAASSPRNTCKGRAPTRWLISTGARVPSGVAWKVPGRVPQLVGHRAVDAGRAAVQAPPRFCTPLWARGPTRDPASRRCRRGRATASLIRTRRRGRRLLPLLFALRPHGRPQQAGDAHGRARARRRGPRGGLRRGSGQARVGGGSLAVSRRRRAATTRSSPGRSASVGSPRCCVPAAPPPGATKRRREGARRRRRRSAPAVLPRPLLWRTPAPIRSTASPCPRGGAPVPADGARVRLVERLMGAVTLVGTAPDCPSSTGATRSSRGLGTRGSCGPRTAMVLRLCALACDAGGGLGAAAAPAPARPCRAAGPPP